MDNNVSIFSEEFWSSSAGGKMLTYEGQHLKKDLDRNAVRKFVHAQDALGARWTYDYDCGVEGPWYECVCDIDDYDIDKIQSRNTRHNIHRGLKRCTVRKIDYSWLADNGYEVYVNATSRYSNFKPVSKDNFSKVMANHCSKPGREAFGAFVGEKLVAFSTQEIRGEVVGVHSGKFDPAYSKEYPMYALLYTISHHYLKEQGHKEIQGGSRPLLHETDIGDFLLRLGWRKAYCRLGIYLVFPVRFLLILVRIFNRFFKVLLPSRHFTILQSLLLAQDIAKATRK